MCFKLKLMFGCFVACICVPVIHIRVQILIRAIIHRTHANITIHKQREYSNNFSKHFFMIHDLTISNYIGCISIALSVRQIDETRIEIDCNNYCWKVSFHVNQNISFFRTKFSFRESNISLLELRQFRLSWSESCIWPYLLNSI